jgi:hypothetical protein
MPHRFKKPLMFWASTRQLCGAEEKHTASDPLSLIARLAFCKAHRTSTFQNTRLLPLCLVHNLLEPLLFNNGTTIALLEGACFDRMQEDVL